MSTFCKTGWAVGFALLLTNCASSPFTGYSYNEVVIVNQMSSPVSDVAVTASDSGRLFSCANIAPRGICSNSFPSQSYRGKPIQVTWMIANGTPHSKTIELTVPQSFVAELPMRGILIIDARGQVSAYLQQQAPGPHL